MKKIIEMKNKAFTLVEMKDTKIRYTLNWILMFSAVTCTLFISPLTITF